jgi:tRNA(Arg) A34 adenosine deaminase TadA
MCLTAILWARCDRLFYANTAEDAAAAGFDDSYFYEQVRKGVWERDLLSDNFLRDEAGVSFKAWREYSERVEY